MFDNKNALTHEFMHIPKRVYFLYIATSFFTFNFSILLGCWRGGCKRGSENAVKNTGIEILALGGTKMEGVLARAAAKRRPSWDLEVGRQIRLSRISSLKRQNNAKNVSLFRHGPTSSPNGGGAGSVEKDIELFNAKLSVITKIVEHNEI